MAGHRRVRILGKLVALGAGELATQQLCDVCADVTAMTGVGIMLMSGDLPRGSLCTTDGVSDLIERLQFSLGEGPCVDAYHQDRPVLEPNLASPVTVRWPGFSGPAVAAGARAVFGFPLRVGAVRLGAMNLYRGEPGSLTDEQHADAFAMADIAAEAILLLQANAAPGQLAVELGASADFQYEVHQASGMVAAQLNESVAHALVRLRGYAFGNERTLIEVAHDVVARTLRFEPDPADPARP